MAKLCNSVTTIRGISLWWFEINLKTGASLPSKPNTCHLLIPRFNHETDIFIVTVTWTNEIGSATQGHVAHADMQRTHAMETGLVKRY